ncbi:glycosylase [Candidatus Gottesmanbacteria bacterium RIFCSPLOWO2_01_FULL_39_12b]|uniref:Glycosylase n=1 Tax=Candidatus Gottesmanbacteria bacterium RIFCSPLOWO2_01_FULL_39_12b TaxID=1798388 RepID=A0A1F6AQE3_9BACT|nr:MAG: glycosylase [Candidatus Gottesmanbacteria bacterium RIFCSPLOWO2_01_FULL_39_12b]
MFKWKKLGRVFNPTKYKDKSWMREFAQAPSVLIFDKFVRVFFACRPLRDKNRQYVSYTGFVDLNRYNLFEIINISKRPILQLGERGTFDEFGTYPVSVIRKDNEIIAYYGGWTRCESIPYTVSIGVAKSHDNGVHFTKFGRGPLLSSNILDPYVVSGPKVRRFNERWYLWYVAGTKWLETNSKPEAVYKIRMAYSVDGINWTRNGKNLIENKIEKNECQASPDVIYYKEKYHMFFCYKYSLNFRNNKRGYKIGYAYSDDLTHWIRDDTKAGIDISRKGWDGESIAYPHVFELDNNLYMLYLGNQVGRYGFGLAQLEDYKQ